MIPPEPADEPDSTTESGPAGAPEPTEQPTTGRRRRLPLLLVAAAGSVVLLAGVLVVVLGHPAAKRHGAQSSASPAGTPLSPDRYQQALTRLDQELASPIQALAAAKDYVAASTVAGLLKSAVDSAAAELDRVVAPLPIRTAHQHLTKAVHQLADDAGLVSDRAHRELLCVGGATATELARDTGGVWLRAAAKELATADPAHAYTVGSFLPEPGPVTADRHLDNGTMLKKPGRRGANQMTVNNTGTWDALVILAPQNSKIATLMVYVRAHSKYTVTGIPDGTYQAYLISGRDWDDGAHIFAHPCHYSTAGGTASMTSDRNGYSDDTLNLSPGTGPFFADGVDPGTYPS